MAKTFGAHPRECCLQHGCFYGMKSCPVLNKEVEQVYGKCRNCIPTCYLEAQIARLTADLEWSRKLESEGYDLESYY